MRISWNLWDLLGFDDVFKWWFHTDSMGFKGCLIGSVCVFFCILMKFNGIWYNRQFWISNIENPIINLITSHLGMVSTTKKNMLIFGDGLWHCVYYMLLGTSVAVICLPTNLATAVCDRDVSGRCICPLEFGVNGDFLRRPSGPWTMLGSSKKTPSIVGWISIDSSYFGVNKKGVQGFDTYP